MNRIGLALLLAPLAGCPTSSPMAPTSTTAPPSSAALSQEEPPSEGPTTLATAFGIDGRLEACRTFDVQVSNRGRTRVLDISVDAQALGLKAGRHTLALDTASPHVRVVVEEHASPLHGETFCTDAGTPNQPPVSATWNAVGGTLEFSLTADPGDNVENVLDLELVDVTFRNDAGEARTVRARFEQIGVGWLPG